MSKTFPSIPDPFPSVDSLLNSARAMKQSLETLTGQRGTVAPTRVYVQGTTPVAERSGDMWVNTASNNKLRVWDGTAWRNVTL